MTAFSDEELADFAATVKDVLSELAPIERVRELAESSEPIDGSVWRQLASLGVLAILVPAEHGGLGGSLSDAAVLIEQFGAHLTVVPFVSSAVMATTALADAPDSPVAQRWLGPLAAGTARATVALDGPALTWTLGSSGEHHLTGEVELVLDALDADLALIAAEDGSGQQAWFGLPVADLQVCGIALHDPTRRAAAITVRGSWSSEFIHARAAAAASLTAYLRDVGACAVAADSVGSAQQALDLTVSYVKTRTQFGHPIGTFQAVKHCCTEMFIDVVAARAALHEALDAFLTADADNRALLASVAKVQGTVRHVRVAGNAMQLHGGIGFTWEHELHFHLKRAMLNEALYGAEIDHARTVWQQVQKVSH